MTVPPRALLLAGLCAVAAAWTFPLQLALDVAGPDRQGMSWREAEGTIWSGTLRGARWQGLAMGDVHVALSPASLIAGAPASQ